MFRQAVAILFLLISTAAHAAHQVKFVAEVAMESPQRVAPDLNGNMYVTTRDGSVAVYTLDGKNVLTIHGKDPNGDPLLKKPAGIVVYGDNVYVCDTSLDRVVVFSRGGGYRDSFGEGGSSSKQLSNPSGIFVYQGVIYVADYGNDRIQVFQKDGKFVKEMRVLQNTLGDGSVWDIAFSRDPEQKYIFLADGKNERVYVLDRQSLNLLTEFGDGGRQPGQFFAVHSIATDSKGNIYTTETYEGKRLQKFVYKGMATVDSIQGVVWPKR